jgi:hypothetical protein
LDQKISGSVSKEAAVKVLADRLDNVSLQTRRVILGFVLIGVLGSGLGLGLLGYFQLRDSILLPENQAHEILGHMIALGNTLAFYHEGVLSGSRAKRKADYQTAGSTLPALKLAIEASLNTSAAISEIDSPRGRKAQNQLQDIAMDIRAYFKLSQEALNAFEESYNDSLPARTRRLSQDIGMRMASNEVSSSYAAADARLWESSGAWQVAVKQAKEDRQRLLLVGALLASVIVILGAWQVLIRGIIRSLTGFHQSRENNGSRHPDQGEEPITERQRDMMELQVLQFLASVRTGSRNADGHCAPEKAANRSRKHDS